MEVQSENNSMQINSPVGEFLQSQDWRKFQENVGRKTFHLSGENFWANIIEHTLPIVGKPACIAKRSIAGRYFYVPRGPIFNQDQISKQTQILKQVQDDIDELINLAKENNVGWIRIEPETDESLETIRKNTKYKIAKAPHDMQPKEIFAIDITKSEEELLAEMKPKTRYNIKLAEKKGVNVFSCCHPARPPLAEICLPAGRQVSGSSESRIPPKAGRQVRHDRLFYIDEFIRLTAVMAARQGITAHPENYYRKMLEVIPGDILKLYVAEFEGKIIAANLVVFYGDTGIYLHGASDDNFRNVMAPYLLQWQQIIDAKKMGCARYDFGGVKTVNSEQKTVNNKNTWSGITKFKLGFSPKTLPTVFLGSYDIIINPGKYILYKALQSMKLFLGR